MPIEKQIIELEKKIMFQDHAIEELKEAILAQQKQIKTLENELHTFKDKMTSGPLVRDLKDEEKPPHY